jgi:hypothetical protein
MKPLSWSVSGQEWAEALRLKEAVAVLGLWTHRNRPVVTGAGATAGVL